MEEINPNSAKEKENKGILYDINNNKEDNINENNYNFDKYIYCPICNNEFHQPIECEFCHKIFCEQCIKNYLEKNKTCPSNCKEVILKTNRTISNIINELIKIKSFKEKTINPTPKKIINNNNSNFININNIYEENKEIEVEVEDINKYDYKIRFEDLYKDFLKFKNEFNIVNDENFNLRKENWNLKTENINLNREKDNYIQNIEEINQENIRLEEEKKKVEYDFKNINKNIKNENYLYEIKLLKDEVTNLKREESKLNRNNQILKENNNKLNQDIESLKEEIEYYDDYYEDDYEQINHKKKKNEWY